MKRSKISFLLNETEMTLFREICFLEPCLAAGVEGARKRKDGQYRVRFCVDDLAESLEALSFSVESGLCAGKTEETRVLLDKIKGYLVLSQGLSRRAL